MSRIHEALKKAEQEKAAGYNSLTGETSVARQPIQAPQPGIAISNAKPSADISRVSTQTLPEILRIEDIAANCPRPEWKPDASLLVFSNANPFNAGTEQFRTLRSRLYRMRENQPLHTILISSAIPAEGKTLVAANLAQALARQQGSHVLLIDADIRAPRLHTLLGSPSTPGLADYLQGGKGELEVIQRGPDDSLCFIPAGATVAHPSELISNLRMKQLLDRVKSAFDWIIIDSPPVLPVADASVLGGLCDGVLVVVRANSTPSATAQKACREFKGSHILGVVLNTVDDYSEYGSYYHAYGAYGDKPSATKSAVHIKK